MSDIGPNLQSMSLWARREIHFLNVVRLALKKLQTDRPHPTAEPDINRKLYDALLKASRELDPKCRYPAPMQEACNQPDLNDATRARREEKRPDFQWGYLDPHEPESKHCAKQFVVECKRLGISGRADWVLNENYVVHGIVRFVLPEWSYAQRFSSALMIGYWQNMALATIMSEVNTATAAQSIPCLVTLQSGPNGAIYELEHTFSRPFPISPFRLRHIWVDLR